MTPTETAFLGVTRDRISSTWPPPLRNVCHEGWHGRLRYDCFGFQKVKYTAWEQRTRHAERPEDSQEACHMRYSFPRTFPYHFIVNYSWSRDSVEVPWGHLLLQCLYIFLGIHLQSSGFERNPRQLSIDDWVASISLISRAGVQNTCSCF